MNKAKELACAIRNSAGFRRLESRIESRLKSFACLRLDSHKVIDSWPAESDHFMVKE
jgi:hypothetical protein